MIVVGILTFLGNWIGPVFWSSAGFLLLSKRAEKQALTQTGFNAGEKRADRDLKEIDKVVEETKRVAFLRNALMFTAFEAASVVAVMAACTVLRTHLFIWTVFSPKYLYCMAWALGHHLVVTLLGGALYRWGSR